MFRAFDPDRDRLVAVKLFRLDLPPERVHRLVADFERLIAAGVTHSAVIAPVATGIEGVSAYLAQDYAAAESLDITLRHGPSSIADALRVATQLAGALDAAAAVHIEHGVLHPRDVLLSSDETRLTGLGIARAVERVGVATQVRRPYTAPERTVGSAWGRQADVFGLAALVHEMLWARRVAATGERAADSLTEIPGGDLPRLRALFGRALADDPAERFDTALEFAGALEEALSVSGAVRRVRLQPDRAETVRLKADTTYEDFPSESEPGLCFESPAEDTVEIHKPEMAVVTPGVENAETAVKKEPEPVVMRGDFDLRPPVLTPELVDAYRPAPDSLLAEERSRSAISPLAFALVIGAALGFAGGFGVGTWGRSTDAGEPAASESRVASKSSNASALETAATTGPAHQFTEGKVDDRVTEGKVDDRAVREDRQAAVQPPAPQPAPAAPIVGSLLVRSMPLGARVLVDGREYGRTPLTVGSLSRGAHRVRVIRDGYVPDERVVTITSAQRAHSVTARLAPERAAPAANAVKAAGATNPIHSPGATGATRPPAPPAPPAPPGVASLTVDSRPAGARVFLDGRLVGTTPLVLPGVTVGEHAVYLDRDGYKRWSSAIRIITTENNRVTASLDR